MPHKNTLATKIAADLKSIHHEVRFVPECAEIQKVVDAAAERLRGHAATGDYLAFQELYYGAFKYAQVLRELAKNHFQKVGPYIERKICWPLNAWPGTKFNEDTKMFLSEIQLGAALPFDLEKFVKQDTVARTWVFNLIRKIDIIRHQQRALRLMEKHTGEPCASTEFCIQIGHLPDLVSTTVDAWFEAAWQILLDNTDKQPEKHPELRPLGLAGNITNSAGETVAGIIRDNIKKRLLQTLTSVVRSV